VAMAFVQMLSGLEGTAASGVKPGLLEGRYGVPVQPLEGSNPVVAKNVQSAQDQGDSPASSGGPLRPDAHGWLEAAAARHTSGDTARMAQRFLDDFRRGMLGPLALELP